MRKFEELKEAMPTVFEQWMSERDIVEKLDSKWTSRESWYFDKNGLGTQDIKKANIINDEALGYCTVEFGVGNVTAIKVYLHFYLKDWDEEEQQYLSESSEMVGWDFE